MSTTKVDGARAAALRALGERIKVALARIGSVRAAAALVGSSKSAGHKWTRGAAEPGALSLWRLAQAAEVDLVWLVSGRGSPEGRAAPGAWRPDVMEEVLRFHFDLLWRMRPDRWPTPDRFAAATLAMYALAVARAEADGAASPSELLALSSCEA